MKDKKDYSIVGEQSLDSTGKETWKEYLNSIRLSRAWSPPNNSPYADYAKYTTINSIDSLKDHIKPRYSEGEKNSEIGIDNLIRSGNANNETAIILDSGGAHSVAMAIKLMEVGYQPIIMLDSDPHPDGSTRSEQGLAALLYFAGEAEKTKNTGKINTSSPPVFIMDCHRRDGLSPLGKDRYNNSHEYIPSDLPDSGELITHGISRVIYVNEGDRKGRIEHDYQSIMRANDDIKPVIQSWGNDGIEIKYTGVKPWVNDDRFKISGLDFRDTFDTFKW